MQYQNKTNDLICVRLKNDLIFQEIWWYFYNYDKNGKEIDITLYACSFYQFEEDQKYIQWRVYKINYMIKNLLHELRIYEILVISSKIFKIFMSDRAACDITWYHILVFQFFSHHELFTKHEISEITYFPLATS